MGLINFPGPRSKGTEHKLIAAIAAEENLRTVAKQNGFTISGGGSWK
jgi:hypothetical protein